MLNQIVMVGRITKNPELKTLENEKKGATITLAIPRSYKNENGEYDTDFITCKLWNGIAEDTCEYFKKGDLIGIKGRLQSNEEGQVEVVAEKVSFLATRKSEED